MITMSLRISQPKKKKNNEFEIVVIFFDVKMCFRLLASREEKFGEEFKIAWNVQLQFQAILVKNNIDIQVTKLPATPLHHV